MVNVHCYTSARQSEVCQAKYRVGSNPTQLPFLALIDFKLQDLECIIGYYNGEPDIKLKFTREFCKAKNVDQWVTAFCSTREKIVHLTRK